MAEEMPSQKLEGHCPPNFLDKTSNIGFPLKDEAVDSEIFKPEISTKV